MDWKKESEMFNQMADYYDKYRPNYPDDIIRAIIGEAGLTKGSKLLEIGAGSGKATAQFANFGFEMLCIEPGEDLVKKGNETFGGKNIEFVASRFEDYDIIKVAYFDAIISAQAFHWVSQPEGYVKCAKALKDDGYLALFWNYDINDGSDYDKKLAAIAEKYGAVSCISKAEHEKCMGRITDEMAESGLFSAPKAVCAELEINYSTDEYFGYFLTGNVFVQKSEQEKQRCFEALKEFAERHGGIIKRSYTCKLYLAQKL